VKSLRKGRLAHATLLPEVSHQIAQTKLHLDERFLFLRETQEFRDASETPSGIFQSLLSCRIHIPLDRLGLLGLIVDLQSAPAPIDDMLRRCPTLLLKNVENYDRATVDTINNTPARVALGYPKLMA